mgnify:CR=1 FL=1
MEVLTAWVTAAGRPAPRVLEGADLVRDARQHVDGVPAPHDEPSAHALVEGAQAGEQGATVCHLAQGLHLVEHQQHGRLVLARQPARKSARRNTTA